MPALAIVSLLCVLLLSASVPVCWKRIDLRVAALIAWLIIANIVHGVNALLSGHIATDRAYDWCDTGELLAVVLHPRGLTPPQQLAYCWLPRSPYRLCLLALCTIFLFKHLLVMYPSIPSLPATRLFPRSSSALYAPFFTPHLVSARCISMCCLPP
jgi:hypothetical protein